MSQSSLLPILQLFVGVLLHSTYRVTFFCFRAYSLNLRALFLNLVFGRKGKSEQAQKGDGSDAEKRGDVGEAEKKGDVREVGKKGDVREVEKRGDVREVEKGRYARARKREIPASSGGASVRGD